MIGLIFKQSCNFARKLRVPKETKRIESKEIDNELDEQLSDQFVPFPKSEHMSQKFKSQIAAKMIKELAYEGEDPTPHKLVNRPSKGAVWGLGGQLILAASKMQLEGLKLQKDRLFQFLELHQVKDLFFIDFHAENPDRVQSNRQRYHIIGSCFSARHCWKVGIELKNSFNMNCSKIRRGKLGMKSQYDPIEAILSGGKNDEWALVSYKNWCVSLMTEEQRQAVDLEWKWLNPVSEERQEKYMKIKLNKKGRKNFRENL